MPNAIPEFVRVFRAPMTIDTDMQARPIIQEISMKTRLFTALFALLILQPALACELWYDEYGRLNGGCRLQDMFEHPYQGELELRPELPRLWLQLANLRFRKFKYEVYGREIWISADVENTGNFDTPPFDLALLVTIMNPRTGSQQGSTWPLAMTVAGLPAGTQRRDFVGIVAVPDTRQDWDLSVMGVVDPPESGRPSGNVFESDENDNVRSELCRFYGEEGEPANVPPCN